MRDVRSDWAEELLGHIRTLAGEELVQELQDAWRDFLAERSLHITLIGTYNAGKSSLLKRLLAEAGLEVPEWLTIGARQQTFEVKRTSIGPWSFGDTPGIIGSGALDAQAMRSAIAFSDAFMVVLGPSLAGSNELDDLLRLLSGRYFTRGDARRAPAGAMHLVIARMDGKGVDPAEDPRAFEQLVEAQRQELESMLIANRVDPSTLDISFVVADPGGMVANRVGVTSADYPSGHGIAELRQKLQASAGAHEQLREDTYVRFLLLSGHDRLTVLSEELTELEVQSADAKEHRRCRGRFDAKLDALVASARADMQDKVDAVLRTHIDCTDERTLADSLAQSLPITLEAWQSSWNAQLQTLALTELDDVEDMLGPNDAGALGKLIDLPPAPTRQTRAKQVRQLLMGASGVSSAVTVAAEAKMRKSLPESQRQMAIYANARNKGGDPALVAGFSDVAEAERTRHRVANLERGAAFAEAIVGLVGIADRMAQTREAEKRDELLAEWRKRSRKEALRIGEIFLSGSDDDEIEGWSAGVDRVRDRVYQCLPVDDELETRLAAKRAALGQLASCLERAPSP